MEDRWMDIVDRWSETKDRLMDGNIIWFSGQKDKRPGGR
jgi:hypothetical protein